MRQTMLGWGRKNPKGPKGFTPEKQSYAIPTVKFDPAKVTEAVKADLRQNIESIREIPSSHFDAIYNAALRSITAGRALHILYQALIAIDGITKRRAENISLALNNKATALMQAGEQERLGIKYAIWLYSGAPCGDADTAHRAANGKPYPVNKGMLLNGKWTRPGREDGCKCVTKSIVEGFDGHAGGRRKGVIE